MATSLTPELQSQHEWKVIIISDSSWDWQMRWLLARCPVLHEPSVHFSKQLSVYWQLHITKLHRSQLSYTMRLLTGTHNPVQGFAVYECWHYKHHNYPVRAMGIATTQHISKSSGNFLGGLSILPIVWVHLIHSRLIGHKTKSIWLWSHSHIEKCRPEGSPEFILFLS